MDTFKPITLEALADQFPDLCEPVTTDSRRLYWTTRSTPGDAFEANEETFFLARLNDALIFNNGIVIMPLLGLYISDTTYPESFKNAHFLKYFRIAPDGTMTVEQEPPIEAAMDAALAVGGDNNHYHSLLNWYSRAAFARLIPDNFLPIVAMVHSNPIPQHRELIEALTHQLPIIPFNVRFNAFYRVKTLFLPSFIGQHYFSEFSVKFIRGILEREFLPSKIRSPARSRERLFIARRPGGNSPRRMIENQDEVATALKKQFGFETVDFELMTLRDQVSLMRRASAFVSPQGAGLTNAMFCQPLTKSVIIENSRPNMMMFVLLNFFGLNVRFLQSEDVIAPDEHLLENFELRNRNMLVDVIKLSALLAEVLSQPDILFGTRSRGGFTMHCKTRDVRFEFGGS